MTFLPNKNMKVRRIALAAAAAVALSLSATASIAQPAGGMMHGGPGMQGGPGMHGAGIEQMIPKMLAEAKASLNLNTSQQAAWDSLVAQSKAARDAARANRQQVKDALAAQLAKAEPDLAALAAVADGVEQQNRAQRKALRDQWIAFYTNTFTPEQKAIVRDLLQKKLARAQAFHQGMLEHLREHFGATGG